MLAPSRSGLSCEPALLLPSTLNNERTCDNYLRRYDNRRMPAYVHNTMSPRLSSPTRLLRGRQAPAGSRRSRARAAGGLPEDDSHKRCAGAERIKRRPAAVTACCACLWEANKD
jgi:hypothetical protein